MKRLNNVIAAGWLAIAIIALLAWLDRPAVASGKGGGVKSGAGGAGVRPVNPGGAGNPSVSRPNSISAGKTPVSQGKVPGWSPPKPALPPATSPWVYQQGTGHVQYAGATVDKTGYSGRWDAKNKTQWATVPNLGPIPQGTYQISAPFTMTGKTAAGKTWQMTHVMRLTPIGHNANNRNGFLIHGDSNLRPGDASKGCIILPLQTRQLISQNGTGILIVK